MSASRRVRVVVSGRVQGVFFRATCAAEARTRGLGGWVRNRNDGTVEAMFDGDGDAVAHMIAWCREGPAGARVTHLEVHDETPTGEREFRMVGR
jgi:acylphosphatase